MSLKTKLIVALSILLAASFVSANVASFLISRQAMRTAAMDETLPLIAQSIHAEVQQVLIRAIDVSSLMANDTFLKDWVLEGERDLGAITKYLAEIKDRYGYLSSFFVSETTGRYYYPGGILKNLSPDDSHDVWYAEFKALETDYDLDVDTDEASNGTLTVFINHRLRGYDGRFLGATGVGLRMDWIGRLLSDYQRQYKRLIFLVDAEGLVQAHPERSLIQQVNIRNMEGIGPLAPQILSRQTGVHSFVTRREGHPVYLSALYFPGFDWYLLVVQDEMAAMGKFQAILAIGLLIGLATTAVVVMITVWTVNRFQGRLELLATTDAMTGLLNRRRFVEMVNAEMGRVRRYGRPAALLVLDVDNFKKVNDEFGHPVGDQVLQQLAERIRSGLREIDTAGRIGGEEFAVLLPEIDPDGARAVAERIRTSVACEGLQTARGTLHVTLSIGLALTDPAAGQDFSILYHQADHALLQAKQAGRNRVCCTHRPFRADALLPA